MTEDSQGILDPDYVQTMTFPCFLIGSMNKNVDNTVVRTKSPLFETFLTAQNVGAMQNFSTGLILSELILIPVEPTIYHRTYHRISQI
jgi:hypothetical protein